MDMIKRLPFIFFGLLMTSVWFVGCEQPEAPSLYDDDYVGKPTPQITSVEPAEWWFAGVGTITITGTNFSADPDENFVYFNTTGTTILQSSPTQLQVRPPNLVGSDLKIRVSVLGAEEFSEPVTYRLEVAVEQWGGFLDTQQSGGIAADPEGNIYVGVYSSITSRSEGILKITPDLETTVYGQVNHNRLYRSLRFGPEGFLYSATQAATRPLIARIPPGGGSEVNWLPLPVGTNVNDIEFDEYGNLWAAGNNENVFRIQPSDASFVTVPFAGNIRGLRYYNGYLYLAGTRDNTDNIWRVPVDAGGNLGEAEVYFAFSAEYGVAGANAYAITFAADGSLYIGTNGSAGILAVAPDKSWEPMYPGLLVPRHVAFTWDQGTNLFSTQQVGDSETRRLIRINTLKEGAPYYGFED